MRCPGKDRQQGFTLMEVLVSMAIGLTMLGALTTTFAVQRDAYDIQDQITGAVQTARAVTDMMIREVRMAGYDPEDAGFTGIPYNSDELRIVADLDKDGITAATGEKNEEIVYRFFSDTKQIKRKTAGGTFQPFAESIQAFEFEYLDSMGAATTTDGSIRQIRITVTARTDKPDGDYPANGGYRQVTLGSLVTPHNLSYP
jgi:prepilin-type N-terminal cleavage/methylation domain-containing protein